MGFFESIISSFRLGGVWMWAIMAFQVASLIIIADRVWALYIRRKVGAKAQVDQFEAPIRSGELEVLKSKTDASINSPLVQAMRAGLQAAMNYGGKDEIQGKMDEVLLHENSALEKRTGFLAMLGNVATLTGLLGTITGMIKSFAAVSEANPADKAALLARGISEAMNATAYGLITAIPALVAFAILTNRANQLAEDLNQSALKVYNWLSFAYDPLSKRLNGKLNRNKAQNEAQA